MKGDTFVIHDSFKGGSLAFTAPTLLWHAWPVLRLLGAMQGRPGNIIQIAASRLASPKYLISDATCKLPPSPQLD